MAAPRWEHFDHMADIGVRGIGRTLAEAFEQAGLALTAVIVDPGAVGDSEAVEIRCEAPDQELLFVEWLNALIYEMATRRLLFSRFRVHIDDARLHAEVRGETADVLRHAPAVEVKGATYTELFVGRDADGWRVQCVVDV